MLLRAAASRNFAEMEFLQNHHAVNTSESPYTLGTGEPQCLSEGDREEIGRSIRDRRFEPLDKTALCGPLEVNDGSAWNTVLEASFVIGNIVGC